MGTGRANQTLHEENEDKPRVEVSDSNMHAQEEKEMFSMITKPRVRYDVEVVTKLIVYSGTYHVEIYTVYAGKILTVYFLPIRHRLDSR